MNRFTVVALVAICAGVCFAQGPLNGKLASPGKAGKFELEGHELNGATAVFVIDTESGEVWSKRNREGWSQWGEPPKLRTGDPIKD